MFLNEQDMISFSPCLAKYGAEPIFLFEASSIPTSELEGRRKGTRNGMGVVRVGGGSGSASGRCGVRGEGVDRDKPLSESVARGRAVAYENVDGFVVLFMRNAYSLPKSEWGLKTRGKEG